MIFKEEKVDYDFNDISPTDYEIKLELDVNHGVLNRIFVFSKKIIAKKDARFSTDLSVNSLDDVEVQPQHINYVKTVINKMLKKIELDMKLKSQIKLVTSRIIKAVFKHSETSKWRLHILVGGEYVEQ